MNEQSDITTADRILFAEKVVIIADGFERTDERIFLLPFSFSKSFTMLSFISVTANSHNVKNALKITMITMTAIPH